MGEKNKIRKVFYQQLHKVIDPKSRDAFNHLNIGEGDLINLKYPLERAFEIDIQLEDIKSCQTPYDVRNLVKAAVEKREREYMQSVRRNLVRVALPLISTAIFGFPISS